MSVEQATVALQEAVKLLSMALESQKTNVDSKLLSRQNHVSVQDEKGEDVYVEPRLENNERVRYGVNIYGTRDTLFTRKIDGWIYFGISRCREEDHFVKREGRYWARSRCWDARGRAGEFDDNQVFSVNPDNLSGRVKEVAVKMLLTYFYDIVCQTRGQVNLR